MTNFIFDESLIIRLESVGAIAEEVKEEVPVVQKAKKTRGKKREEGTVQDKFSDDE